MNTDNYIIHSIIQKFWGNYWREIHNDTPYNAIILVLNNEGKIISHSMILQCEREGVLWVV